MSREENRNVSTHLNGNHINQKTRIAMSIENKYSVKTKIIAVFFYIFFSLGPIDFLQTKLDIRTFQKGYNYIKKISVYFFTCTIDAMDHGIDQYAMGQLNISKRERETKKISRREDFLLKVKGEREEKFGKQAYFHLVFSFLYLQWWFL